jgi:exopolyphosphatase / guanosine-5'-triphosphate,3'-diphosphate pyrophosphatase
MRIGIIDLGTNSVRFAIYRADSRKRILCEFKRKLMLRPGRGVFKSHRLKSDTIRLLVKHFKKFAVEAERAGVDTIRAVATASLREAKNANRLVEEISKKTGIELDVISGRSEARLIAKGILKFETCPRSLITLIDIGGGSTEITFCKNLKLLKSLSLPVGAFRLEQLFLEPDPGHIAKRIKAVEQMRRMIKKVLTSELYRSVGPASGSLCLGSSGTIRALGRILDRRHARPGWVVRSRKKPRLKFTRQSLRELIDHMLPLKPAELVRIPGMEKRRKDIILSGAILLLELLEYLHIERVETTNYALRDGLLLEVIEMLEGRSRPTRARRKRP